MTTGDREELVGVFHAGRRLSRLPRRHGLLAFLTSAYSATARGQDGIASRRDARRARAELVQPSGRVHPDEAHDQGHPRRLSVHRRRRRATSLPSPSCLGLVTAVGTNSPHQCHRCYRGRHRGSHHRWRRGREGCRCSAGGRAWRHSAGRRRGRRGATELWSRPIRSGSTLSARTGLRWARSPARASETTKAWWRTSSERGRNPTAICTIVTKIFPVGASRISEGRHPTAAAPRGGRLALTSVWARVGAGAEAPIRRKEKPWKRPARDHDRWRGMHRRERDSAGSRQEAGEPERRFHADLW